MSDTRRDYLREASDIMAELLHLRAQQCINCGMAFENWRDTHKPKGWWLWRRPLCEYRPVGFTTALKDSGKAETA